MAKTLKKPILAAFFVLLPACSLFVSLDDLQKGGGDAGSPDATTPDGSSPADATSDGALSTDATDAAVDTGVFVDDFNRPDADLVGNDWTEKNPLAFTLSNGAVQRTADMSLNFADDLVYRPAAEDVADVDVSIEFMFQGTPGGYPQLHVRAQRDTIATAAFLDSYICYMSDAATLVVSRAYDYTNVQDFGSDTIAPPVQTGDRYRLHCRVTGTDPVTVVGTVDHFVSGSWMTEGVTTAQDMDAGVMVNPGSVGFSGSNSDSSQYVYDNFVRTFL